MHLGSGDEGAALSRVSEQVAPGLPHRFDLEVTRARHLASDAAFVFVPLMSERAGASTSEMST